MVGAWGQLSSINLWKTISVKGISHVEKEEGCPLIDYWPVGSSLLLTMWSSPAPDLFISDEAAHLQSKKIPT